MSAVARACHLHVGRQSNAIKRVGIHHRIISSKKHMAGNGNMWHERCGTALAVVIQGIAKATLWGCIVFIELIERQALRELDRRQVGEAGMPVGDLGAQELRKVSLIQTIGRL
jgi:hypothetical protein